jgi:flagellar basal-body rod protein FlgB
MRTLFDSIDRLGEAMSFHRERQSVLAGNIANLDTPGYRPLDIERTPATDSPEALTRTNSHHLDSASSGGGAGRVFDDGGDGAGADGNAVNLERELAKIDANRVRYTTASELASRRLALLRYAAGDGNG